MANRALTKANRASAKKETVGQIKNPDDMNRYIQVLHPQTWLALALLAVAIVAFTTILAVATDYSVGDLLFGFME